MTVVHKNGVFGFYLLHIMFDSSVISLTWTLFAITKGQKVTGRAKNINNKQHHFILLPEDGDHNEHIFSDAPYGQFVDVTPPLPTNLLPSLPTHFQKRGVEQYQVAI